MGRLDLPDLSIGSSLSLRVMTNHRAPRAIVLDIEGLLDRRVDHQRDRENSRVTVAPKIQKYIYHSKRPLLLTRGQRSEIVEFFDATCTSRSPSFRSL
jgi:hypothetical protein